MNLIRHYDEKGYNFDWVLETNPLAYFTALVGLSKIVRATFLTGTDPSRAPSMRSSRGSKSRMARKVRAAFEKFLAKVRPTE